jgi:CCR4-NOT transcriptional regulation complex NOT5 subunit
VYTCYRASIEEEEAVYRSVPAGYQTRYNLAFFDVSEITETHEFSDSDFLFFIFFQKMGTSGSLILKF